MKNLFKAGDIILIDFPGVLGIRRGPALVLSVGRCAAAWPDLIVGQIASQTAAAVGPTDCVLQDWAAAGLGGPSAFRSFFATVPSVATPRLIGRLTDADWNAVRACLRTAVSALDECPAGHD